MPFGCSTVEHQGTSYNADIVHDIKDIREITLSRPTWKGKNKNEGAFFKHYNNTRIDLGKFGVHNEKQEDYNENCLVQALITLGIDEEIVKGVRSIICSKYVPTNKLSKIAEKHKLYFRIKTLDTHKDTLNFGDKKDTEVLLGLIDQHYFAVAPIQNTMYSIKHYFQLCEVDNYHNIFNASNKKSKDRYTNSWEAIKYMFENKSEYLRDIPFEDLLATQYHNEAKSIVNLKYPENAIRENMVKESESVGVPLVFFDFETTTNELIHKPYMVCNSETSIKYGEKCGLYMLRDLYNKFHKEHKSITLIAHNAGYDFRFIQQYLQLESLIERGHNVLEAKGRFYYSKGRFINIILKDSYAIISMPLKKFGKCFSLDQAKEILPYSLYTAENIADRYLSLDRCKTYCDKQVRCDNLDRNVTAEDYNAYFALFVSNATKWNCLFSDLVDILEYSKVYCEKDVEVLQKGYSAFGDMLIESCGMYIEDFMSSAQLAHQYMLKKNVFGGVMQLSSTPREYIMQCMVGGRTMCCENKKQHIIGIIDDFDAVSLYPSAMHRLGGYLMGSPKVLENKSYAFLERQDGYFVQIKVLKVFKKYKFPLMSYINEDGVRIFTNAPKGNLHVCKIDLEDLIKFHQIEFEIIDGYYYDEGRNNELKEVIDFVFNERIKLKDAKNPLQEIYKLIMNSSYGKTLQKAFPEEIKFVAGKDLDNCIDKHYNRILHYEGITELYGENEDNRRYKVKMEKGINDHYNNCHCGVEVLAMSKRIMNEVMTLAEDNALDIYYQDTDSMHIKQGDIKTLACKYKEMYGKELIGKGMNQFHTDFSSDFLKGEIHAVECLFLGKKCYLDKLVGDEEGVYDYHIRMKGIPNGSIKYKAKVEGRSVMEIYKSLYSGMEEVFDLCCDGDKVSFEFNSNYTISSRVKFERKLKFHKLTTEIPLDTEVKEVCTDANHFIYKWSCKYTNLTYVGSSNNCDTRKAGHIKACNDPKHAHHNVKLYQVMREYGGICNWNMEVIDAFKAENKRAVQEREQMWIDKLKPSLNMINALKQDTLKEFNF